MNSKQDKEKESADAPAMPFNEALRRVWSAPPAPKVAPKKKVKKKTAKK